MKKLDADIFSINDVLHTLKACDLDSRFDGAFEHMVAFASELTGLSEDFLIDRIYEKQAIDFGRLSFRDFDDSALPVQFFFGYDVTKEQRDEVVASLGYRTEDCMDFELVLDVFEKDHCPLEAVLTFADADVRWVDIAESVDELDSFIQIIRETDTDRARRAMECLKEMLGDYIQEAQVSGERQINREKLAEYLAEEMIVEFESEEECKDYFNTYDGQNFETVADMKKYQGAYGFGLDGKWYHISFEEALDVWEPASLDKQILEAEESGFRVSQASGGAREQEIR